MFEIIQKDLTKSLKALSELRSSDEDALTSLLIALKDFNPKGQSIPSNLCDLILLLKRFEIFDTADLRRAIDLFEKIYSE